MVLLLLILHQVCKLLLWLCSDGGGNEIYDNTQSCRLRCTIAQFADTRTTATASDTPVFAECDCHLGCLQTATCCPDYASYCMLGQSQFVLHHCNIVCMYSKLFIYLLLKIVASLIN
jgi:hypothetical protein